MTLKNSSHKLFWGLFFQSLKLTVWIPLLFFAERIIHTFGHSGEGLTIYKIGFFWDSYLDTDWFFSTPLFTVPAAILTAVILFSFAWSKKQTNVLFSFGMTRTEIFGAKMLAGILPIVILMPLAAGFEIFANLAVGYTLSARYLLGAIFILINSITPYIVTFCISATVIANTTNVIEGGVFTFITMAAPSVIRNFAGLLFTSYTLGASEADIGELLYSSPSERDWNWTTPFFNSFSVKFDDYYGYGEVLTYFNNKSGETITLADWSGAISAVIYSVIAVAIGLVLFKRKKNENAATFGKNKGFTEFGAVIAGIFIVSILTMKISYGEGTLVEFLPTIPMFFFGYFAFKLVFSHKRLRAMKKSLKRIPAYTAALFAFLFCIYCGGFGYASYVPKAEDVQWVSISSPFFKGLDDRLSGKAAFGFKEMNTRNEFDERENNYYFINLISLLYYPDDSYYDMYTNSTATFYETDEIAKVTDVHKAFVKDSHISSSGKDTQGTSVIITYRLKNGAFVTRNYFRTTEETMQKFLLLNDTQAIDNEIDLYFGDYEYKYEFNSEDFAGIDIDEYEAQYGVIDPLDKSSNLHTCFGYLFPKDMSKGYNLGHIDEELFNALREDLKAQSAQEHYHHSAEDEIGIITYMADSEFPFYTGKSEMLSDKYNEAYRTTSWNINTKTTKSFVITKDMANTVNYLEKYGLMKHLQNDRTVEDISYIRLATLGELYGKNKMHFNMPLFYGAFQYNALNGFNEPQNKSFNNADPEKITDKSEIQALLDEAVLFGYCSNDSKIVEITYNDGVVASVMIPANASQ